MIRFLKEKWKSNVDTGDQRTPALFCGALIRSEGSKARPCIVAKFLRLCTVHNWTYSKEDVGKNREGNEGVSKEDMYSEKMKARRKRAFKSHIHMLLILGFVAYKYADGHRDVDQD